MTKPRQTYLDPPPIDPAQITSSTELRYVLIDTLQTLLQQTNHTLITPSKPTLDPETFLNSLKTHPNVYRASLSRQFAADFSPDIEQTTLKDEPKDWYIKTADFGDECDRVLQHRDGEYTQLLEDLQEYQQIFQQGCDRIIILRPPNYGAYNIQLNAAMQCLGYSPSQFQYLIIQPIQLYAFHKPSQQLHTIPDLSPNELMQAIGSDALRWHCFSPPLTQVAPINISTAGQPTPKDSLYQVQLAYARCCTLLHQAHEQGIIQLNTTHKDGWIISPSPRPLAEYTWDSVHAHKLVSDMQAIPQVVSQSAIEVAPHLLTQHLESISKTFHQWLSSIDFNLQNCALLLAIRQSIFYVLESLLGIHTADALEFNKA